MSNKVAQKAEKMTKEMALKAIEEEKKERVTLCAKEVEEALAKNNCEILVGMLCTPKGNFPQMQIASK